MAELITKTCEGCEKPFETTRHVQRFCTHPCWLRWHNKPGADHSLRGSATAAKNKTANRGRGTAPGVYVKYHRRHEHRVIVEQALGRPLEPGEVVHHEDRNSRNNDLSNLILFPSQAEHLRHHLHQRYHPGEVCTCGCFHFKKQTSASS